MNTHIYNEIVEIERNNKLKRDDEFKLAAEQWFIDNQVSFEAMPGLLDLINEHFEKGVTK